MTNKEKCQLIAEELEDALQQKDYLKKKLEKYKLKVSLLTETLEHYKKEE